MPSYPAHGWLPPGAHFDWQHPDQGRDFVTDWQGVIQAPGDGVCVAVWSDRAFPNGFGPAYPIVRITTGPFAKGGSPGQPNYFTGEWYVGHCTSLVQPGQAFTFGQPLARADQGHNFLGTTGGWVELGMHLADGTLGPYALGHWFDALLQTPLVVGAATFEEMADTIGQNLGKLISTPYWGPARRVASYTTRDYQATDQQFAALRLPVKIDQAPTDELGRGAQVKDVEPGAASIQNAVNCARRGLKFTTYLPELENGYSLNECEQAMHAAGVHDMTYWVANWGYTQQQAIARLGGLGGRIVAVQWASPTSNPGTLLPGTSMTLNQANADLSVCAPGWLYGSQPLPPEDTMSLISYKTADNRVGLAVETQSAEVLHIEQQNPSGIAGKNSDWWRKADGSPNWLTLGKPGA